MNKEVVIKTFSGKVFHPLNPRPEEIDIVDIAHALSQICRFNGHTKFFYSIAQHCLLVSQFCSPRNKLAGLLHDASEAYICDMAAPVKKEMSSYRAVEKRLQDAINLRYGLIRTIPKEVKLVDEMMLNTEGVQLMGWSKHVTCKVCDTVLTPKMISDSKYLFLEAFNALAIIR